MKKICIALDYNPNSEKIAAIGHAYARALRAETILVHVISEAAFYAMEYEPFMGYDSPFHLNNLDMVKELEQGAENFLLAASLHLGTDGIKTQVLEGETSDAILSFCRENRVDLLVIGTHSHSVLENVLMGNTAVKIVRHTGIPLLVVPTKMEG
ncbi:universal stress protein [Flagellimonas beolgyonensis]|uniref:universal stress protein n=1 Tax=Flagellimonas beolgyonensis TaxID=864064 RepID=UPI003D6601B6